MTQEYNPNLLEKDLKNHDVINIDIWVNYPRLTIKTKQGAYIDFTALLKITENGIFPELRMEKRK